MRRREFVIGMGLSGATLARPILARAQQPARPVIGYLGLETLERYGSRLRAFREGLASIGFQEGRNVTIEFRWAGGHNDLLPLLGRADEVIE